MSMLDAGSRLGCLVIVIEVIVISREFSSYVVMKIGLSIVRRIGKHGFLVSKKSIFAPR